MQNPNSTARRTWQHDRWMPLHEAAVLAVLDGLANDAARRSLCERAARLRKLADLIKAAREV